MTPAEEFNEYLLATFDTPAGQKVLVGLMNRYGQVLPPEASDGAIRYREGQRSVLAEIMRGISDGRERRRAAGEQRTEQPVERRAHVRRHRGAAGRGSPPAE